jgi:hypothetical protein
MNSYILESLEGQGVPPDYRFDPEVYRKQLETDGHVLSDKAHLFLTLWGGLSISIPAGVGLNGKSLVDFFHTYADTASRAIYPVHFRNMEKLIGEAVCPVGEKDCGHTTITIGTSGAAYESWDGGVYDKIMDWKDDDFESLILYLMRIKK